jgi:acetolactate synthase-1/2/3 large subunit
VQLVKAYGIEGNSIDDRKNLKEALQKMLDCKDSYLLEVMVGKEDNVFPMVPQGCSVSEIRLK